MRSSLLTSREKPRVVLFDLFGTLVFFRRTSVGSLTSSGSTHPRLAAAVERELPGVPLAEFLEHVRQVSREIVDARRETQAECSSHERFRRVLSRLGAADDARALRLCEEHMGGIFDATEMPASHLQLLRSLAPLYRIGLVSNFDHAPTARAILRKHGLAELLDPIIISDEIGWRKPRLDIFHRALAAVGEEPQHAVFVGDTPLDDIHGARCAGMRAIWVNPSGGPYPAELQRPSIAVGSLMEIDAILRGHT